MSARSAKEILGEVLEVEPAEREALLARLCGEDRALRAAVEELLRAHARSDGLFGAVTTPARAERLGATPAPAREPGLAPGERLGPYRILSKAGSGGFGTVYLADQREPVARRVALKVLHAGLSSEAARARFQAERQALARMQHPGIALVFDAGTDERGHPYFALEYVPGEPITEWCARRGLGLRERLALFRTVCNAVQHAHEKGVVHRDLKPSNVLVAEVDGAPAPKVIDFGIAKALDREPGDAATLEGQLVGTPAYMSPEQAAGLGDVDTRTDVYALGALLYELACGVPPFDAQTLGLPGVLRAIVEQDPPPPSRRAGPERERIPADLDWIVLRCLEKERERRYASASALAEDVGRFLADLPVEAAPPGVAYRLRKLVRRHRLAVFSAAALILALLAGAIGTGVGLVRASRANRELAESIARERAEAEHARLAELRAEEEARNAIEQGEIAQAVNLFLTRDLLASAIPSAERGRGRDVLLRDVLDVAAESLERGGRFEGKPLVEGAIRDMLGAVYAELGELEAAARQLARAIELRAEVLGDEHRETLSSRRKLGLQLRRMGRLDEADLLLAGVVALQRALHGPRDPQTLLALRDLALLRVDQGRVEEAYALVREAWETGVEVLPSGHPELRVLRTTLAIAAQQSGRDAEALEHFRAALALSREELGPDHPGTVGAMNNLAALLRALARFDEAEELMRETCARHEALLGPMHPDTGAALFNLGALLADRGRYTEGEELLRRALATWEGSYGSGHARILQATASLARCLEGRGERAEAERLYRRALEGSLATLGEDHPLTDSRRKDLSAFLFADRARRGESLELLEQSLGAQRRTLGPDHPNTLRSLVNLALMRKEAGSLAEAEELLIEALEGFVAKLGPEHVEVLRTESALCGLRLDQQRFDEALELGRSAVERAEHALGAEDFDLARLRLRLGLAYEGLGRLDDARRLFGEVHEVLARTRPDDKVTAYAAQKLAEWGPGD